MEILRTPEERFAGLPGYPFEPRYTNLGELRDPIPGAQGQPHTTIEGGGHFLQETRAEQFSRVIIEAIRRSNP